MIAEVKAGIPHPLPTIRVPVKQILGRNPGPMTGPGTNSYLIGARALCLVDPGPEDAVQHESFLAAIGDRKLEYILLTHTHGDHSPGAQQLQASTGARIVVMPSPLPGQGGTEIADQICRDGDVLDLGEYSVRLIHTPGHVSNHYCYLLQEERLLFTGDHVLEGTTSVILPPDGDMGHYMDCLYRLQEMDLRYLAPGHGRLIESPRQEIDKLIAHRQRRESKILNSVRGQPDSTLDDLVAIAYDDVPAKLHPLAKKTMLAHLLKLERESRVSADGPNWRANQGV